MRVSPFDHYGHRRSSDSFTPEEISNIEDDKLERFFRMVEALKANEAATAEANAAEAARKEIIARMDALQANAPPKRTFMDNWRDDVRGRV